MGFRTINYKKTVLKDKPNCAHAFFKCWGGIGDFYYFLTFVEPILRDHSGYKRVLLMDLWDRYRGNPVIDVCLNNGLIDEVWIASRKSGGSNAWPLEVVLWDSVVLDPNIYWQPPGNLVTKSYHTPSMREDILRRGRYLVPMLGDDEFKKKFPLIEDDFITMQSMTSGKKPRDAFLPQQVMEVALQNGTQVISLFDPRMGCYCPETTATESIQILARSKLHIGVESSQLLAAAIHGVNGIYTPAKQTGWLGRFTEDLNLKDHLIPIDRDVDFKSIELLIRAQLKNGLVAKT